MAAAGTERTQRLSGITMPYVNIRITREGATEAQKAELIKGATDLLVRVLGKNPNTTVVTIDEVAMENWGIGGVPAEEFRRQLAAKEKK